MSRTTRILFSGLLLALLTISIAMPARAFEDRTGATITIAADEIIEDDLYVGAEILIVDGVIKGDLIVGAATIIINGTVEGDLIAGARDVVINGTIQDDARIFGAAFLLGETAIIGDDLVGAGGSLETRPGSSIGGDLMMGDGQNLLAGDIAGDVKLGTGAVELRGSIDGDAVFAFGNMENEGQNMGPMQFGSEQGIATPALTVGLKFGPNAKIGGTLEYISDRDLNIPASIAGGNVTRTEPVYSEEEIAQMRKLHPTPGQIALDTSLKIVRNIFSLILVGLFLGWLFPNLFGKIGQRLQANPLPSLGSGFLAWAGFFFGLLLILFVMTLGGIIFGLLTLGNLSGAVIWTGLLALFGLSVSFALVVAFITKVAVSLLIGKLLLEKFKPEWAEHKFWPLALGVVLFAVLSAIPGLGWIVETLVGLLGLGALWLLGKDWWEARRVATA